MSGVNKVFLLGRVGKDPEVRSFTDGGKVASFSLATSKVYKDKSGEKKEQTEWHNIRIYGILAQTVQTYVHKGDQLHVEGELRTSSYEDKEGVKRYITEIIVTSMTMLGSKKADGKTEGKTVTAEADDDLPF